MEDFQMEVRDLVTLKSQPKWFYLEPDAVKDFTNVHLISSDGFIYRFSGAMLASTSRFLRLILQEAWPETLSDDIIVQTEVPKDQLPSSTRLLAVAFCQEWPTSSPPPWKLSPVLGST